jgi:MFS family permease
MVTAGQVLRYPAVRRYLVSTALSALSVNILVTVLFRQTFDISGDELDIGFIGLAQFVPAVLLVLVSGWVADRFDRRRVTALFLFGRAACAGGLVVYSVIEPGVLWPLFAIAFLFGTADAMANPARRAIPPLIAEAAEFPQVVALWTATFTGASIAGPVIGGFLYSVGPAEAYGLAGLLEFAAIFPLLAITYIRPQERLTERPTIRSAMEGLHFIRRTPVVLAAISLDLFAVLFGGAMALIPAPPGRCGAGSARPCSPRSRCSASARSCSASPAATRSRSCRWW